MWLRTIANTNGGGDAILKGLNKLGYFIRFVLSFFCVRHYAVNGDVFSFTLVVFLLRFTYIVSLGRTSDTLFLSERQ